MAINKIVYGNDTLVDLTSDTVSESDLAKGKTAHDKSGNSITGTFTLDSEIQAQDNTITQIQEALVGKTATPDTSDANASPSDIRNGKSAYVNGNKIIGSVLDVTQGTPSISVSFSGLITAKATQSAGYISAGTKSSTKQLTVQDAQIITPSLSEQTIESGKYLTGTQTISAITKELLASLDSDFIADNIAEGIDLFGLVGTFAGGGETILRGTYVPASNTMNPDYMPELKPVTWLFMFLVLEGTDTYSNVKGRWAHYWEYDGADTRQYTFGYNNGTGNYYTPYVQEYTNWKGDATRFGLGINSQFLAGKEYRWIAGVTST